MFLFPMGAQSFIQKNITLTGDQVDWNLIADGFGGDAPTRTTRLTLTINAGVNLTASSVSPAALNLGGLPTDSTITLINNGNIYGAGGAGGHGENTMPEFEPPCMVIAYGDTVGVGGGRAIAYDGTNVDLAITNASGRIWSGGGGGGGGGGCWNASCSANAGGGGGGGAGGKVASGFGAGGVKGTHLFGGSRDGSDGSPGTGGTGGAGGSGGAGGTNPACSSGAGGAGGNFGAAGSGGGAGGKAGGNPGLAIHNAGTGTTSWTSGGVQGVDLIGVAQ